MKKLLSGISLETIRFQNPAFFDDLTSAFGPMREAIKKSDPTKIHYSDLPETQAVVKVIQKKTNLNIEFHGAAETRNTSDFAIMFPYIVNGHIFETVWGENTVMSGKSHPDKNEYLAEIFKKHLDKGFSVNSVDLLNNKVSGFFADVPFFMEIRRVNFVSDLFTDREIAAIVLHEIGHAFTIMEYVNRTAVTNQVLADISRGLSEGEPEKVKTIIVHAASEQSMTNEQREALLKCKEIGDYVVCAYAIADELSKNQLGYSLYETVSCELLADMYATRCGAGRDLVTGLTKLGKRDGVYTRRWHYGPSIVGKLFALSVLSTLAIFSGAGGAALAGMLLTAAMAALGWSDMKQTAYDHITNMYDSDQFRFERIRQQLVHHLKDMKLPDAQKKNLLLEIADIEKAVNSVLDAKVFSFSGKAAKYLSLLFDRNLRKLYDIEELQKELEALASNNLFVQAAKLQTN